MILSRERHQQYEILYPCSKIPRKHAVRHDEMTEPSSRRRRWFRIFERHMEQLCSTLRLAFGLLWCSWHCCYLQLPTRVSRQRLLEEEGTNNPCNDSKACVSEIGQQIRKPFEHCARKESRSKLCWMHKFSTKQGPNEKATGETYGKQAEGLCLVVLVHDLTKIRLDNPIVAAEKSIQPSGNKDNCKRRGKTKDNGCHCRSCETYEDDRFAPDAI
mmetsp:Transcript_115805/g.223273  ORF Transcript_115805/g.223273 Transcript_115805/m.223273 type:complete len:215 (-) Transcript_115805:111-755(-)